MAFISSSEVKNQYFMNGEVRNEVHFSSLYEIKCHIHDQSLSFLFTILKCNKFFFAFMTSLIYHLGCDPRKRVFRVCEQHRHRPACTYAQSDQCFCYLLNGKYHA